MLLRNSSSVPSNKKRIVRPREVVLSTTSATKRSLSPKYNLLPTRILRAGSTNTSHKRNSLFSSRSKKTSMVAPVFSLFPYKRAGKTLVLFKIITSFSSKYPKISLKILCSIAPVFLFSTINLASSLFSDGLCAINASGKLNLN